MSFERIRDGAWLSDIEINAFQVLLKEEFKNINGLEDPIIIQSANFIFKSPLNFIRIMLSRFNHWICVAGGEFLSGTQDVCIFDSLNRTHVEFFLGETIKKMIKKKSKILCRIPNTQKQQRQLCGHFALANATAILYGFNPEKLKFEESELVEHFINCIKQQKIKMFPFSLETNSIEITDQFLFYE